MDRTKQIGGFSTNPPCLVLYAPESIHNMGCSIAIGVTDSDGTFCILVDDLFFRFRKPEQYAIIYHEICHILYHPQGCGRNLNYELQADAFSKAITKDNSLMAALELTKRFATNHSVIDELNLRIASLEQIEV